MRYDQFGDMGHPIDRMSHRYNMTVPGVLGYRPQKTGETEQFSNFDPFEPDNNTGANIRNRYSVNPPSFTR